MASTVHWLVSNISFRLFFATLWYGLFVCNASLSAKQTSNTIAGGALSGEKLRVVVSTDIGGTDPDDFQSLVHLLLYADVLEIEGLISSPYGPGRKQHILDVLECYDKDFANLQAHSQSYPKPQALRDITKQGETEEAPFVGFSKSTEGSDWIIRCAQKTPDRPLYLLVWGGLEDLTQALHDAPEIQSHLRVYWIGGPNKKWSVNAYQYLVNNFPDLWFIEANDTYRGWFVGGNQQESWGNESFVRDHIAGRGELGNFFANQLGGKIKMGDTPSVAWLLKGNPNDPCQPSWGGQFVRAWQRPYLKLNRLPKSQDQLELFGILEIELRYKTEQEKEPQAVIEVENQTLRGDFEADVVRFRFCPKTAKLFEFKVISNLQSLDGLKGDLQVFRPTAEYTAQRPWNEAPSWWTDNPALELAEGPHMGAKTVSNFRQQFLESFSARFKRIETNPSR